MPAVLCPAGVRRAQRRVVWVALMLASIPSGLAGQGGPPGPPTCAAPAIPVTLATLSEVKRLVIDDAPAAQRRRDSLMIPTLDSAVVRVVSADSLCARAVARVAAATQGAVAGPILLLDLGPPGWWVTEFTRDPGHPNHFLLDRGFRVARLLEHPFDP